MSEMQETLFGLGTFGKRPKKCLRCKKHCSRNPKRYEGMPPKKFSKIQNDFLIQYS